MPRAETVTSFVQVVNEAQAISSADAKSVVILGLEHYDSGAKANYVADTAEGKAALGALCNLCARRARNGAPVVRLTAKKYTASSGVLGREPQFVVLDWEIRRLDPLRRRYSVLARRRHRPWAHRPRARSDEFAMTTYPYQNFDIDDPLGILAEQGKGRFIDMATVDWFRDRGVSPINLFQTWVGWSDYVRLDDVVFLPRGTFEFGRYKKDYPAVSALTFVCWDTFGDAQDVCAWQPATGKTATWSAALLC